MKPCEICGRVDDNHGEDVRHVFRQDELFQERAALLQQIDDLKARVYTTELSIAEQAFAADGYHVGDTIFAERKRRIIVGVTYHMNKPYYRILAARIKKDGTLYNERNVMYGEIVKLDTVPTEE